MAKLEKVGKEDKFCDPPTSDKRWTQNSGRRREGIRDTCVSQGTGGEFSSSPLIKEMSAHTL